MKKNKVIIYKSFENYLGKYWIIHTFPFFKIMTRLIYMPPRKENWTWVEFFKEGYLSYDIFNLLRIKNKALTGLEIALEVGKKVQKNVHYQLDVLAKRKLIFKSSKKIKYKKMEWLESILKKDLKKKTKKCLMNWIIY